MLCALERRFVPLPLTKSRRQKSGHDGTRQPAGSSGYYNKTSPRSAWSSPKELERRFAPRVGVSLCSARQSVASLRFAPLRSATVDKSQRQKSEHDGIRQHAGSSGYYNKIRIPRPPSANTRVSEAQSGRYLLSGRNCRLRRLKCSHH